MKELDETLRYAAKNYNEAYNKGIKAGEKLGIIKGRKKGKLEAKLEGKIEIARKMLEKDLDYKFIFEITNIPINTLKTFDIPFDIYREMELEKMEEVDEMTQYESENYGAAYIDGGKDRNIEIAKNMLTEKLDCNLISKITDIPLNQIKKLQKSL